MDSDFDDQRWVDVLQSIALSDPLLHLKSCLHCPIWGEKTAIAGNASLGIQLSLAMPVTISPP